MCIHIDRVVKSAMTNTRLWAKAELLESVQYDGRWAELWDAAESKVGKDELTNARIRLNDMIGLGWDTADDAIIALLAWPECAYMLDSDPDELRLLAKLGVLAATAFLVPCIVFAKEKELV